MGTRVRDIIFLPFSPLKGVRIRNVILQTSRPRGVLSGHKVLLIDVVNSFEISLSFKNFITFWFICV